ncbi:MAG: hypothetical protein ACYCPN_07580 [Thermoplasmata archaeon]
MVLALYATIRDYRVGSGPIPAWVALGVFVVFLWGFLTTLFAMVSLYWGTPTRLTISSEGVELQYPPGVVRFRRRWSDPRLQLVLRDFREHPGPASHDIVLDTGDHSLMAWLLPSRRPPSAYLTPEAFDAVVAAAQRNRLAVSRRKGSSAGWVYKNDEVRITRSSPG